MPHHSNVSSSCLKRLTVLDLVAFGNTGANGGCYALRLSPPDWESWSPGQFVMIRPVENRSDALWGRPFSICRVSKRDLVIFFQVRGRATTAMSRLAPGDELNVWGPLGNALLVEPKTPTLILAGGIGIAPFVGYAQNHPTPWELSVEFGHRLSLDCYPFDSLNEKVMAEAHWEQSAQDREAFLELVKERIGQFAAKGLILACGPTPFLAFIQAEAAERGARAQLSLETRMACGVGACLGCVVRAVMDGNGGEQRNVQTCTCGPNFWSDKVILS